MFPQQVKSRGLGKGAGTCSTHKYIEFGGGNAAGNMGLKSLFSGKFRGEKPRMRVWGHTVHSKSLEFHRLIIS